MSKLQKWLLGIGIFIGLITIIFFGLLIAFLIWFAPFGQFTW